MAEIATVCSHIKNADSDTASVWSGAVDSSENGENAWNRYPRAGDEVRIVIDGIGELSNPVVEV
ncbi:hypothetical protein [Haloprofundus halobius]|uniref:hypothetical protein n=1 Tax=Haloprofundus halobius TaxID=2876194 RepID=UPI001CC90645|nr:hypothetical protein [Haloprofundus halobius]